MFPACTARDIPLGQPSVVEQQIGVGAVGLREFDVTEGKV
jgi:hypothetical protein